MAGLDDIIHQSTRLRIMTALNVLQVNESIEFVRLKALTEASDGNLGAHLDTLARAGYVTLEKQFVGKKPQTRIHATAQGRASYQAHVTELRRLLSI